MQKTPPFWRRYLFVALFALLIALAGFSLLSPQAQAAGTVPGGTVPPGGTIPPGGTTPPPPTANQGQINIVDQATFSGPVEICTAANVPVTGATSLDYGDQTGFQTFPAGVYDWKVTEPGCGATIVDIPPFKLNPQAVLTLVITGNGSDQPFNTVLVVQNLGLFFNIYLPLIAQNL